MSFTRDEIREAMLLYAVTDRSWLRPGQTLPQVVARVLDHGATFLQIREKDLDPETFEAEAAVLKTLCQARRVPFVVNDSVEIALACGADGVAVVSAIFGAEDPGAATAELLTLARQMVASRG